MKPQTNYRRRRKGYVSPYKQDFWLAVAFILVLVAFFLLLFRLPVYLAYMAAINIVTFGFYGYDKDLAKKGGWRVPELILHLLAVLGGAAGGIAGQWLFYHKVRKRAFHLVLWSCLIAHIIIFIDFYPVFLTYTDIAGSFGKLVDFINSSNKH